MTNTETRHDARKKGFVRQGTPEALEGSKPRTYEATVRKIGRQRLALHLAPVRAVLRTAEVLHIPLAKQLRMTGDNAHSRLVGTQGKLEVNKSHYSKATQDKDTTTGPNAWIHFRTNARRAVLYGAAVVSTLGLTAGDVALDAGPVHLGNTNTTDTRTQGGSPPESSPEPTTTTTTANRTTTTRGAIARAPAAAAPTAAAPTSILLSPRTNPTVAATAVAPTINSAPAAGSEYNSAQQALIAAGRIDFTPEQGGFSCVAPFRAIRFEPGDAKLAKIEEVLPAEPWAEGNPDKDGLMWNRLVELNGVDPSQQPYTMLVPTCPIEALRG